MGKGWLKVEVFLGDQSLPIKNALVLVKDKAGNLLHRLVTDENGITEKVMIEAPDLAEVRDPLVTKLRFNPVDVVVSHPDNYEKVTIHGVQIFDKITSILPVQMHQLIAGEPAEKDIFIPPEHGVDIPDVAGGEEWTQEEARPGEISEMILANEVAIPQYITVHLGSPNADARNVRVPFKDYVKNVASSEIFPFWEEAALYANIYSQISFVLNRVYTVWYRSRGKDFDITNNTAFDQYFVEGRSIFENISRIVDGIFNMFIRREGRREPFFASYCNGTTATCDGLSQWGSQNLAEKGYTPIQILRYYFPNDIQIVESTNFTSQVGSYPGVALREGSTGEDVRLMQVYLNRISGDWYIPPIPNVNGVFGSATKNTVMEFQRIFNLVPDGIIGRSTWYEITKIYVAVKQLAELTSEGERIGIGKTPPTTTIQLNSRGELVVELQFLLNYIAVFFSEIPFVVQSGVFRDDTKRSVVEFQKNFGLTADGVVGPATWSKLYSVFHSIHQNVPEIPVQPEPSPDIPAFPGIALRIGSKGNDVLLMQNYLNAIGRVYPTIPSLVADGIFGQATHSAVTAFQRQFGLTVDGVIGQITWYRIVEVYNSLPQTQRPQFPGTSLRLGSRGDNVRIMQNYLNSIARVFPAIPSVTADGVFGTNTQSAVTAFQSLFGLTADGVIGVNTWNKILDVFYSLPNVSVPQYPGTSLRVGSRGDNVLIMQKYLNTIAGQYPSIPKMVADGVFGANTQSAVIAFQRLFNLTADGVIGRNTWNKIVSIYNKILMGSPSVGMYSTFGLSGGRSGNNTLAMLLMMRMLGSYYYY